MTGDDAVERGLSVLALDLALPQEVFRLATLAVADDETNVHAPDVREELQRAIPVDLDGLVEVLRRRGFELRKISGAKADLSPSASDFPSLLRDLLSPLAYESLRRDPPIPRLETARQGADTPLAEGDNGPELVDQAGYGILTEGCDHPSQPVFDAEISGPLLAHTKRNRLIHAINDSFNRSAMTKADIKRLDRAMRSLHDLNDRNRDVERAQDLATVTIVREVTAALAPAQVALSTHRRFLYVHAARLMELADLVRQPDFPSDDPDGARYDRVRKAFQRHEREMAGRASR